MEFEKFLIPLIIIAPIVLCTMLAGILAGYAFLLARRPHRRLQWAAAGHWWASSTTSYRYHVGIGPGCGVDPVAVKLNSRGDAVGPFFVLTGRHPCGAFATAQAHARANERMRDVFNVFAWGRDYSGPPGWLDEFKRVHGGGDSN